MQDHPNSRIHRPRLALLCARGSSWANLWLSRAGPYEPERGFRFNPAKLLIDPYAKALAGSVDWNAPVFGYELGIPKRTCNRTSATMTLRRPERRGYLSDFDWENDRPPLTPLHDSVIYEVHVKGFTARIHEIPEEIRGTYAGLAHPAMIELSEEAGDHGRGTHAGARLPRRQDPDLESGLRNYWGYNTINFFSPGCALLQLRRPGRTDRRIQGDGEGAAPRGHRSDSRRGLQPHRGRQSAGPHAELPRHRQSPPTIAWCRISRATTWTTPAPATP